MRQKEKTELKRPEMPKSDLKILIEPGKDTLTVSMIGEAHFDLDVANERLDEVLAHKPKAVLVEASKLTFISSTGICFLLNLRKAIKQSKGTVTLSGLRPLVKKTLEHARVLQLFEVADGKV